ncbi:hypothetical protein BESB_083190 [Besnoitia besnoiti]|uniref:Btz domain-containing protein n=1 Tax=Besnoitia besnoiti TaxID=94643 RepID=A0A2A9MCK0_BESBE|nr:hypothetical protein BESB_083190 [Besnoitia besnoiti]PFH33120.1 hypothetical protein BESB_083190 [Besnoitia besnoiti]
MERSKNLRRDASGDEDDKDVFDDDLSAGSESSDEEADVRRDGAAQNGAAPAPDAKAGQRSPGGEEETGGDFSTEQGEVDDGRALSREAENGECDAENNLGEGANGKGGDEHFNRQLRGKSTWQLIKEDPSFVPRGSSYFLHDDRGEGELSGEEPGSEDEVRRGTTRAFADEESEEETRNDDIPRSTQTRVGRSRKLWSPEEREKGDGGKWLHDRFETLLTETEPRGNGGFSRGRGRRFFARSSPPAFDYQRRPFGGGRGGRRARWAPRGGEAPGGDAVDREGEPRDQFGPSGRGVGGAAEFAEDSDRRFGGRRSRGVGRVHRRSSSRWRETERRLADGAHEGVDEGAEKTWVAAKPPAGAGEGDGGQEGTFSTRRGGRGGRRGRRGERPRGTEAPTYVVKGSAETRAASEPEQLPQASAERPRGPRGAVDRPFRGSRGRRGGARTGWAVRADRGLAAAAQVST